MAIIGLFLPLNKIYLTLPSIILFLKSLSFSLSLIRNTLGCVCGIYILFFFIYIYKILEDHMYIINSLPSFSC